MNSRDPAARPRPRPGVAPDIVVRGKPDAIWYVISITRAPAAAGRVLAIMTGLCCD